MISLGVVEVGGAGDRDRELCRRIAEGCATLLYKKMTGKDCPKILRDENGAPYFSGDSRVHLSLSYTDGCVAVLLTDLGRCGVDTELERCDERIVRTTRRFVDKVNISLPKLDKSIDIYTCFLNTGSDIDLENPNFFGSLFDSVTYKKTLKLELCENLDTPPAVLGWTRLEALLKCTGLGFGAFRSAAAFSTTTAGEDFCVQLSNGTAVISVAIMNKG